MHHLSDAPATMIT